VRGRSDADAVDDRSLWLAFATVPLWIEKVGLYQYLGVEILIFATYAMAYNLVLGHSGLPSFGHGAFFGIGAYAFGLAQFRISPRTCGCASVWRWGRPRCSVAPWSRPFISHRRGIYYSLLTIAFGQVFWFIAIKSHAITGGEDGLLKIERLPVRLGFATRGSDCATTSPSSTSCSRSSCWSLFCCGG
jgi:branched-chain amino acid transport system permease protein